MGEGIFLRKIKTNATVRKRADIECYRVSKRSFEMLGYDATDAGIPWSHPSCLTMSGNDATDTSCIEGK
jgi:hypothetical protein